MNKQDIIDIVVETIETNLRNDAPKDIPADVLEKFIADGREALVTTASDIADKVLSLK